MTFILLSVLLVISGKTEATETIEGGRMDFDPGHFSNNVFDKIEKKLNDKIHDGSTEEIYALLSAGYWGGRGQVIIFIEKNNIKLTHYQKFGRYYYRNFSREEFKILQDYISVNNIENLPPLKNSIHDGIQYEYVHLKINSGKRVYINNPKKEDREYIGLVSLFMNLLDNKNLTVGFKSIDNNPNAKILPKSSLPQEWATFLKRFQRKLEPCAEQYSNWQSRYKDKTIHRYYDELYSCDTKDPKVRVAFMKGNYGDPVFSMDGTKMVVPKSDTNWSDPNYVVIIDTKTKKETRVNLDVADNFHPVAYLENHKKFLIERFQDPETYGDRKPVGPKDPIYYLLDPDTAITQQVQGEFFPWKDHYKMPLQKSSTKHKVWAANSNWETQEVAVGLYDTKNFKFTNKQIIKSIYFENSHMWVDEKGGYIYIDPGILEFDNNNILKFQLN